jgi:signal transduction histidine kinase
VIRLAAFSRAAWLFAIAVLALLCGACALFLWERSKIPPDHDYALQGGKLEGSEAFGGAWEVADGAVRNNSDERGAKLVTGSERWKDYMLSADLKFDGEHGDMGVIVRSTGEEEGVDAYNGYYIGLRTTDATLIIGRSDYGWMEARPVPMPGGVHAGTWYRLLVTAIGCRIAASSQNLTTGQTAWIAVEEYPCAEAGRIGLRSLATGGMWRNIHIKPAVLSDYMSLRGHAAFVGHPEFPKREADYNRIFRFSSSYAAALQPAGMADASSGPLLHTGDLQNLPRAQNGPASLRGVVTLASRDLYLQDAEGGVFVTGAQTPPLNVGDEVEATGHVQPGLYSSTIHGGTVRLLWSGAPIPPVAITPLQAASGAYDARFVEIEGRLTGIRQAEPNEQVLEFIQDGQPFSALYVNQPSGSLPRLEINSFLRIRGVCVLDRKVTREITPFAVLLRSNDDIQMIAPPPWWTPWHIAMLFIALIGLALLIQLIYFRIQTWQANAITQERERLAHDIHDTMAQSFAGVSYQIQGIRSVVMRKDHPEFRPIAEQLDTAYQLVRKSHEEASRTIAMLHASAPDIENELVDSLANTARKIAGDHIDTRTRIEGTPFRLNLRVANALLHIGQEAITNAVSHANPTKLTITLRYQEPQVKLIVEDNGSGFDASPETAGFGILGMQKRAQAVGAQLTIAGAPGKGTQVHVSARSKPITFRARMMAKTAERFQVIAKRLHAG